MCSLDEKAIAPEKETSEVSHIVPVGETSEVVWRLPIPGVFEIVRSGNVLDPHAPEFHQLTDVEIVMRDPTSEHLSRADGAILRGIGLLPSWIP